MCGFVFIFPKENGYMRNPAIIKHFSYKTKNKKHTKKAPSKKKTLKTKYF